MNGWPVAAGRAVIKTDKVHRLDAGWDVGADWSSFSLMDSTDFGDGKEGFAPWGPSAWPARCWYRKIRIRVLMKCKTLMIGLGSAWAWAYPGSARVGDLELVGLALKVQVLV